MGGEAQKLAIILSPTIILLGGGGLKKSLLFCFLSVPFFVWRRGVAQKLTLFCYLPFCFFLGGGLKNVQLFLLPTLLGGGGLKNSAKAQFVSSRRKSSLYRRI